MTEWLLIVVILFAGGGTSEHMLLPSRVACEATARLIAAEWELKSYRVRWSCTEVPVR